MHHLLYYISVLKKIAKSKMDNRIIRIKKIDFYSTLQNKFHFNAQNIEYAY